MRPGGGGLVGVGWAWVSLQSTLSEAAGIPRLVQGWDRVGILEQFYSMTSITYLQEKVWPVGCSSLLRAHYLVGSDLWEGQTRIRWTGS